MYSNELLDLSNELIKTGLKRFGLSLGIVSHIDYDEYEVIAVITDPRVFGLNDFSVGDKFPLKDTYCLEVYRDRKTVALTEMAGEIGLKKHPLYTPGFIETVISSPIIVNDKVWGTINFSCKKFRNTSYTDNDVIYIKLASLLILMVTFSTF